MSQVILGDVRVESGSNLVDALWTMTATQAQSDIPPGARVEFLPSGASGIVVRHESARARLIVNKDAGPDIVGWTGAASGDTVFGPARPTRKSGTASGGSTTTLVVTGGGMIDDLYNGLWCAHTPASGVTQYRKITDTSGGNTLTVSPAWTAPVSGDGFVIYSEVSSPVTFQQGTPQDWVGEVTAGTDLFHFEDNPVFFGISSVASRQLTLAAPYTDQRISAGEHLYGRHAVHRAFTTNRGYPFPEPGDTELAAVLKRMAELLDVDIQLLFDGQGASAITNVTLNSPTWTTVGGKGVPQFRSLGQIRIMQGVCVAATTPAPGTNIGTIPTGDAPDVLLEGSSYGTRFDVDASGNVVYQGPASQSNFEMSLQIAWFLGGS